MSTVLNLMLQVAVSEGELPGSLAFPYEQRLRQDSVRICEASPTRKKVL